MKNQSNSSNFRYSSTWIGLLVYTFLTFIITTQPIASQWTIGGVYYNVCSNTEYLNAPFNNPSGSLSTIKYHDMVLITVYGTGQSAGAFYNDCFYFDIPDNPTHDPNYYQFVATIESSVANNIDDCVFRNLVYDLNAGYEVFPPHVIDYNSDSYYQFILNLNLLNPAPSGSSYIRFGVNDGQYGDNTGIFYVEVTQLCCKDTDNDNVCFEYDNCTTAYNPNQNDTDCDGVGDACDQCPGGDDRIDNNEDGKPDCKFPPGYANVIAAWKCGAPSLKKVYACIKTPSGGRQTVCTYYSAVQNHINNGGYLGPCNHQNCNGQGGGNLESADGGIHEKNNPENIITDASLLENDMVLSPNPVNNLLNIDFTNPVESGKISLINSQGHLVFQEEILGFTTNLELDLFNINSSLSSGLYFIIFENADERFIRRFTLTK